MAVSLYTSRVILDVLGVSDFGIYNVIGGIVILISMLNNSMSAATQRFITYELGKHDIKKVSDTFSMSMTAHLFICLIVFLLGETIGLYYIIHYLNIPEGRTTAALWVYQFSLFAVIINIARIPYSASIIAYEKMDFYAAISIMEVLLKLAIVVVLVFIGSFDKLILYSLLVLLTTITVSITYKAYCQIKFKTCNYYWYIDRDYFRKLLNFFGWNFVGGVANTGTKQVGNLIINAFCGTVANAAHGVGAQVNGAVCGLAENFQMAYTPQIVKLYSQDKKKELFQLMNRSALLSYYLLFVLAMPIILNVDLVLGIWLKKVPLYAGLFCQWLIIYNLIDSLQAPMWKAITATGNIKVYEIWLNLVLMLNIPLSYYCLKIGMPPYTVAIVSALVNFLTAIIRTFHVKIQIGFPVSRYMLDVVCRSTLVSLVYILLWLIFQHYIQINSLFGFILFFCGSCLCCILLIYMFGINTQDRQLVKQLVFKRFQKYSKQI
ncbi:MAG: lipopolysaccharide biosynthesis protein [Prevotella sp.]|nr:lipopolysaccharide biosynthesis protein [Prevotella sp.]